MNASLFHGRELAFIAVDLGVARAFWEGVPTARLLARVRLDRDERDLVGLAARASGADLPSSSWDVLLARLLAESPPAFERVKRSVARHGRAASDEGPIAASDEVIAALVHVLLSASDPEADASPAEGCAERAPLPPEVGRACARLDPRLADPRADPRAAAFEACVLLTSFSRSKPAAAVLFPSLAEIVSPAPFYPLVADSSPTASAMDAGADVPDRDRRMVLVNRDALARVVTGSDRLQPLVAKVLAHRGALVAIPLTAPMSTLDVPPVPPSSWLPVEFASRESAARLASALERGATTAPRARALILRGGDAALDAVGAEMLDVEAHPFASAVFADILGRQSRERDVVRLVSYFAIAPDPAPAAHALAVCTAPEVATVLKAWLESLVRDSTAGGPPAPASPSPAAPPPSEPGAPLSARARFAISVAALSPYPHLAAAVKPLVAKVSVPPPPPASS